MASVLLNALAFSGTNFVFSRLTNHGAEKRKKHDFKRQGTNGTEIE